MYRESMISIASFDSLPEEGETQGRSIPTVIKNIQPSKSRQGRPTSNESPRKRGRRDVTAWPVDDVRESKRRKVLEEFYETEKAYVDALAGLITPASASLANTQYNAAFAVFLSTQEADPRCGKLKLRDWLLTIVQRCPRYLLLLKDLIGCTSQEDPEHGQLTKVHKLVSKITLSLNTSLHTHAQTLALLSLQRSTPNLPFQLIAPGRALLKRGPLLQIERSAQPREREFLLFSDCLLWLASDDVERAWKGDWGMSRSGWGAGYLGNGPPDSKSEAELSLLRTKTSGVASLDADDDIESSSPSSPTTPPKHTGRYNAMRKSYHPSPNMMKRHSSSGIDERWVYKGRVELVDLEVVVTQPREEGEERRFEVLSPEGSFVLYSSTEDERDEWCSTIRQAKAQLLVSLNITHPNSTLTSSSSTHHLRRSLQALPFPPSDDRIATTQDSKSSKGKGRKHAGPLRRKVGYAEGLLDPNTKDESSKAARACDACYETVFPLIDPPQTTNITDSPETIHRKDMDALTSLNNLPSGLSMPSLPVCVSATPQMLMAIVREPSSPNALLQDLPDLAPGEKRGRLKVKASQNLRPKSYHHLLEDLEPNERRRPDVLDVPLEEEYGDDEHGKELFERDREPSDAPSNNFASPYPRKEDTARRNKRFSLPAVALHTTSVTARSSAVFEAVPAETQGDNVVSPVKVNKRFSLVLGGGRSDRSSGMMIPSGSVNTAEKVDSIAVGKLSELLGRRSVPDVH
ncbi:hypothetical protein DXG03_001887 [Asterophora parasitica]|uniref:DH domain-containing protein n=1 Tax=Asterophora parasitica TaxID=117018 RepID=A0A9P7KCJ3_9AGAR|nr:hypothetical protein DXG03_001887 [Asterophora parasitica]